MRKIILLWQLKQKIIYQGWGSKLLICFTILIICAIFSLSRSKTDEKVRVVVCDYDNSLLSKAILQHSGDNIEIVELDDSAGLAAIESYRAELLFIIPKGAAQSFYEGQTKKLFPIYYYQGNELALSLAERLVSAAFYELYYLRGKTFATELYSWYRPQTVQSELSYFEDSLRTLRQSLDNGFYFQISYADNLSPQRNTEQSRKTTLRSLVLPILAYSINFIFLLYYGLKLLCQQNKNGRMKTAGFHKGHHIIADFLTLLVPQGLLYLCLFGLSLLYQQIYLFLWHTAIGFLVLLCNLALLHSVKERRQFFPIGIIVNIILILLVTQLSHLF